MVPIVSLSISLIRMPCPSCERWRAAMIPAVSHPAVPPPTMHIDRITCGITNFPADNSCQPRFVNQVVADEEIVAPIRRNENRIAGDLVSPATHAAVQKVARKPTLYRVPLSSADTNWF